MQTEVIGLNAESTLADSLRLMKSSGMSHLIVRSDNNELLGIISKQDILDHILDLLARTSGKTYTSLEMNSIPVSRLMSKEVLSLKASNTVSEAISLLVNNRIKCIPVVDDSQKLIGILTPYDILNDIFK